MEQFEFDPIKEIDRMNYDPEWIKEDEEILGEKFYVDHFVKGFATLFRAH